MERISHRPDAKQLQNWLLDARARTISLVADLSDEQWMGPRLSMVNPMRWEIGHIAWFQEKWILRHLRGQQPIRSDGDSLYDSATVAHDTRWDLALPSRSETLAFMQEVLTRALREADHLNDQARYFYLLALFHEDMHDEALTYTRQTLAYPEPTFENRVAPAGGSCQGDVEVPGGKFWLGAHQDLSFVLDNEKWAHPVELQPFRIARAAVTNAEFAEFVESGGYRQERFWTKDGWIWLKSTGAKQPVYWQRAAGGGFLWRRYDRLESFKPDHPVVHINAHEAAAYCAWAGRRLPTEAEWELAACGMSPGQPKRLFPWGDEAPNPNCANLDGTFAGAIDVGALPDSDSPFGCRQMIGNVWEWTSTRFLPYPGFVADPYQEYSEPWFATPHFVLRGGCWVTRGRLLRNTWRNFYPPDRRDVFAGFRTCAV